MRLIATGLPAFAMVGAAAAADLPASLARMDGNKDGKLSVAEFTADRPALIRKIDRDKDGAATNAEVTAHYAAIAGTGDSRNPARIAKIMQADADRDGKVTAEELVASTALDFKRRDKDGDGFITAADRGK